MLRAILFDFNGVIIDDEDYHYQALRKVLEEEGRMDEIEIREVEEALERIGSGTYGKCLDCGCDIKKERLEAIPYAKYCVKCKAEREKE